MAPMDKETAKKVDYRFRNYWTYERGCKKGEKGNAGDLYQKIFKLKSKNIHLKGTKIIGIEDE